MRDELLLPPGPGSCKVQQKRWVEGVAEWGAPRALRSRASAAMTEPSVLALLVHIVHERDRGRSIAHKPSWRSDVLKRAVSRREIMPVVDIWRAASTRIRCPISGGEEDDGVCRLGCGEGHGGYERNRQHSHRNGGYHKRHPSRTTHFAHLCLSFAAASGCRKLLAGEVDTPDLGPAKHRARGVTPRLLVQGCCAL
jgi:hypothetical protein